jgi:hypothetical protein
MGKYDPLSAHLRSIRDRRITLSLVEIEAIISSALPRSARVHRAWWANEEAGSHTHARAWMRAGWKVEEVDLGRSWVRFVRIAG